MSVFYKMKSLIENLLPEHEENVQILFCCWPDKYSKDKKTCGVVLIMSVVGSGESMKVQRTVGTSSKRIASCIIFL